ncbi:hypothetical protein C0991_007181, partial [Blastosporella zonata]
MSLTPSATANTSIDSSISVRRTRFTTRWEELDGRRAQAVEVTIANLLPAFTLSRETSVSDELRVSITGEHIQMVASASIHRLVPSDQVKVDVFVTGSRQDGHAIVHIHDSHGNELGSSAGWITSPLVDEWSANATLLRTHETPSWWNGAKFGILAGTSENLRGVVRKHHDGFALFDTGDTTHRSSVYLGPKRDFVEELLTTAKREKPNLHRGTYYSLPEWFNPDSAQYGFGQWPGGLAHNPFNSTQPELYAGRLNIQDYIDDLQLPHMLDLALKYETEIMWCDIGGPNKTLEFASKFYNNAWANGHQVTMNN